MAALEQRLTKESAQRIASLENTIATAMEQITNLVTHISRMSPPSITIAPQSAISPTASPVAARDEANRKAIKQRLEEQAGGRYKRTNIIRLGEQSQL